MALISRLPSWILLEELGYIDDDGDQKILLGRKGDDDGDCSNDVTSAEVRGIKISFFAADPPHLSHFSVHGPGPTKNPPLRLRPRILHSVDNLALIGVTFSVGGLNNVEYFIYRVVGRGRRPSLEHLEHISNRLHHVPAVSSVGILPLPCDGDGGFAVAALILTGGNQYGLHVFRPKQGTWTSKVHLLEHDLVANIQLINIEKVLVLSSGEIGFVDLWKGILVFDILQEKLVSRFIPLPKLLSGNQSDNQLGCSARIFRDVIISADSFIKCVEVEACWRRILQEGPQASQSHVISCESPVDVWNKDVLHDSEFVPHHTVDKEDDTEEVEGTYEYHYLGWRVISWTRDLSSTCWHKKFCFHAQDITYPIPAGFEECGAHALAPQDLYVSFPTLSVDSNILYVFSKLKRVDKEFHVAMIDLGNNALSGFSMSLTERPLFNPSYITCDIFKYLNADLGNNGYAREAVDELDIESIYHDVAEVEKGGNDNFCFTSSANKYPPPVYYRCSTPSCFCNCFQSPQQQSGNQN